MWKATINNATGRMIESQSDRANDEAMIGNATRAGFTDISIRIVSDAEHDALIAARGGTVSPEQRKIWHDNSGNASEKATYLPVTQGSPYTKVRIFALALPRLYEGDLLSVRTTYEVTNDLGYNVMNARSIRLVTAPLETSSGWEISEQAGKNITPNMHHDTVHDFGTIVITAAMAGTGRYVNVVAYAASDAAPPSGAKLTVEQDYGRLEAMVIPASMIA